MGKSSKSGVEKRAVPMSLAHLNDSLGYEIPHIVGHGRKALRSKKPADVRRDIQHMMGHAKAAARHNKKLTKKLMMIPSVRKVMLEVKRDSNAAGGPS